MMDCFHGDVEVGLQLLGDYLAENQLVLDRLKTADGKCSLKYYSRVFNVQKCVHALTLKRDSTSSSMQKHLKSC